MTLDEFFAEAKRIGLTAEVFAAQLAERPEFADCLPLSSTTGEAEPVALNREALIDLIEENLYGVYHCRRVWEAWNVGTMSQDDFTEAHGSDLAPDLADAILAKLATARMNSSVTACARCNGDGEVEVPCESGGVDFDKTVPCPSCTPPAATPAAPGEGAIDDVIQIVRNIYGGVMDGGSDVEAHAYRHAQAHKSILAALSNPAPVAAPAPASEAVVIWRKTERSYHEYEGSAKEDTEGFLVTKFRDSEPMHDKGWEKFYAYPATPSTGDSADAPVQQAGSVGLLGPDHTSMRVDYRGLLGQCQRGLRNAGGHGANAEMLRQLADHLKELGQRWYAGDTAVVDEILQLYCIEKDARAALKGEQPVEPSGTERGRV